MPGRTARAVCPASELPPGARRVIDDGELQVLVVSCAGQLFAIENRCSHEDAALQDDELDELSWWIECGYYGSRFDLRTGRALNLPAYESVEVFDVVVEDGTVAVELE